jgi:acyl-CoA synthetase (NDP forming)
MMITALLFANAGPVRSGALASMLDSGGMREQMVDLAEHYGVRFAEISSTTTAVLADNLEAGLDAVNPMDGMGALGDRSAQTFLECGKALLDDSSTALLSFEFEFRDDFSHYPELFDVTRELAQYNDKPVVLINSCSFTKVSGKAAELSVQGIPVINGIDVALRSIRNLMRYSEQIEVLNTIPCAPEDVDINAALVKHWSQQLSGLDACDEITSLQLMSDFGLPSVRFAVVDNDVQLLQAADDFGYPLVLKTAMPGISHKSDINGVIVGVPDRQHLQLAYKDLQQRLGKRVLLMPQVPAGVEVSVGMKNDAQYGPMIIIACGGVLIELLAERAFRLAPVSVHEANLMIDELRLARLLAGVRGQLALDRGALVKLIVQFSSLVLALENSISEIDLNPVIVNESGCTIVDALVIPGCPRLA